MIHLNDYLKNNYLIIILNNYFQPISYTLNSAHTHTHIHTQDHLLISGRYCSILWYLIGKKDAAMRMPGPYNFRRRGEDRSPKI